MLEGGKFGNRRLICTLHLTNNNDEAVEILAELKRRADAFAEKTSAPPKRRLSFDGTEDLLVVMVTRDNKGEWEARMSRLGDVDAHRAGTQCFFLFQAGGDKSGNPYRKGRTLHEILDIVEGLHGDHSGEAKTVQDIIRRVQGLSRCGKDTAEFRTERRALAEVLLQAGRIGAAIRDVLSRVARRPIKPYYGGEDGAS